MLADDNRINLLSGSVRSGKTFVSLCKWAIFVMEAPKEYEFLMVGKTVTSLKRNCLNLLAKLAGSRHFKFSISQKSGMLYGHQIWLEGANDERSETKIRGMTLGGAYCDELTLFPKDFYMMLLSRLSLPGAMLYATTNPDNPHHWVRGEILDNENIQPQLSSWFFRLEDNDTLDPEYVKALKASYTGVFYSRYIEGNWVVAEGIIYPMFEYARHVKSTEARKCNKYWISVDYGTQNATAMILFGSRLNQGGGGYPQKGGQTEYYALAEYYHSGRDSNVQKTVGQYYNELVKLAGNYDIDSVIVPPDPASLVFAVEIRSKGKFIVKSAKTDVLPGISDVSTALEQGILFFDPSCKNTIKEFGGYRWNEKSYDKDEPIKEADHAMDAVRGFAYTVGIVKAPVGLIGARVK